MGKLGNIELSKKTGTTLTLKTNKKYVDSDVSFDIAVKEATIGDATGAADVDVQSTAGVSGTNISASIGTKTTTEPSGYYIRTQATGSGTVAISNGGWVDAGDLGGGNATKVVYFPITAATVTQNKPTINTTTGLVTANTSVTAGYTPAQAPSNTLQLSTQSGSTITPTESQQTAVAAGKYTTGDIKVGAISSSYVGSGVTRNDSTDLLVEGATITAPAGYYATNASASVASGSATTPATTVTANPSISVDTSGLITATASATKSVTPTVSAGYVSTGTAGTITVSGSNTSQLSTQGAKTVTPTESEQTAVAAGKYTTGIVKVGAISSTYVGSDIPQNDSEDLSVSGATVTASAGYYAEDASVTVASGSATTPATSITANPTITVDSGGLITATVSGSKSVTPTVSAGYVTSGTAGTVSVSGSKTSQLTVQAAQTITPGTTDQTIASGKYLTGTQTIKGDTDLTAANIKKGVEIFGVTGTFTTTPSGKTALTAAALRSGYAGFINGSQVDGSMADTSVTEGTTTVSSSTATRGTWSQTAGYTAARTIPAATFANEATADTTYVDISSTTSAPVLVAGDYLYINKGYTDNLKISLARLVPDGSDVKGHGEYILSGHSAYDNDGTLVAGSIATMQASDISVSGATVTLPTGKYTGGTAITKTIDSGAVTTSFTGDGMSTYFSAGTSSDKNVTITPKYTNTAGYVAAHSTATNNGGTAYYKIKTATASVSGDTVSYGTGWITEGSKTVAAGSVTPAVNSHSVSTTPVVTGAISGTVTNIGTTTKPSGTDGTNYWTITPGGSVTTTGKSTANAKATVSAGYIATSPANSGNSVIDITPTVSNGAARYLVKASTSTSNGTATATAGTASTSVTGMVTTATNTGYSVSASATGGNASVTASSATVGVGYNPSSTTASTTAQSATGESASQTKYIQKGVLSASVSSNSGGSASMGATGFTPLASGTSSYYVTLTTSAGSVKAKASVGTEGYVKTETNETAATSVAVSGNGTKLYIPAGGYAGSVSSHSITTTPVVTGALSGTGTNIGTTTKPSGTDGTDYWAFTPGGSVTTTGVSTAKGKATINTAGYIPAGNNESSASTVNITPTASNGTTRYITKATSSTSNGTASATNGTASASVTGMVTTSTNTGYSVSASATGGNASVTASSVTVGAGYNPSSVTASTTAKSAIGTSASETKYIQKGVLSASVSSNSGGSASMAATGFTAASSATSYYVTLSTSAGSVKAKASVSTEGYVKTETNETAATSVAVSGNGNKLYIPAGAYSGSVSSHSITTTPVVTGSISGTVTNIGTTTKPSSGTDGTNYWTITPGGSVTTTGVSTAKGKATVGTAGYVPTGNNESSASTVNITPTVSNGTARYILKGAVTNNTSGGTSSGTINRGSQIKIGAGYYPSDLYYTAQSNSGTLTIDTSKNVGTVSVNGYANISLTGVNIPKPSSGTNTFAVKVPNGSSTITFTFTVDSSGNVTVS